MPPPPGEVRALPSQWLAAGSLPLVAATCALVAVAVPA
jgi:hypothetical protein